MLRDVGEFDGQSFSFGGISQPSSPSIVAIDNGAATIDDAHLLFNSDFARKGNDLHLNGHDGERAIVRDYFSSEERPALLSKEGARLSPEIVEALTASTAPSQYAQAAQPAPAASDAVGRVVTATGDATILRNGQPVALRPGDAVQRADVLQTASGTMAVTFNDGSTLNLTPNTRIVVSEFVYAPNGAGNSQLLDLVQGSLTFISGEVAHSGNMRIGTPVATMGIRGTVGGVTTASDGTVQFYVSQSNVGAVIINQQGQIIANVVQDGPLIVVRPVGPLQVVAEEIGKTPQQLAIELQALQTIVGIKSVGDAILQQFFQQQQPNNPNPQSPQSGPHTQFQTEQKLAISYTPADDNGSGTANGSGGHATIGPVNHNTDAPPPAPVVVTLPANLAPVTFAPQSMTAAEDSSVTFTGNSAITVTDNDSATVSVTVTAPFGTLTSGSQTGTSLTLTGSPAAVNAMLAAMTYKPPQDYNGQIALSIVTTDHASAPITTTVNLTVTPVNDAPVITHTATEPASHTENTCPTVVDATLTLIDVDSSTLSGAKVFISGNFSSCEDVLSFTSHGGITGSYDSETGILTLSGVASLADYQAVLRSVTYQNTSENPSDAPRTISFEVNDGSSEHNWSAAHNVTVEVVPVNDAPQLYSFNIHLNGNEPVTLTPDDYNVYDPDGPIINFTVTNVTGGQFVVTPANENMLFSTFGGEGGGCTVTFTSEDIEAGRVQFIPDGSGAPITYSVSVSDGIAPPTQTIDVVDHQPTAADINVTVTPASAVTYNIVIMLDVSGSMAGQRLADAKAAIAEMLGNSNFTINSVMAASFDSTGNVHYGQNGPWVSAAEANNYFQSLGTGGGTNYVGAVDQVMAAWNANAPGSADKTLVYFISDGEPSPGLNSTKTAEWESFLGAKGVDTAYAIGISPNISPTNLEPISWKPGDAGFDPINLQNASDLSNTLKDTIVEFHSVLDIPGTGFGVDGIGESIYLPSIKVDGVTYSWNGGEVTASDESAQFESSSNWVKVTTALGGTFVFYFHYDYATGRDAGDWSYTPAAGTTHAGHEVFTYTIADMDGDTASADIHVHVTGSNTAPVAAPDTLVMDEGDVSEGLRNLILVNDTDADNDTLTITAVGTPDHGTVDLNNGNPIYTPDAHFSGVATFEYTISDGVGGTATSTMRIDVNPKAEQPVVTGGVVTPQTTYQQGQPIALSFTADFGSDTDGSETHELHLHGLPPGFVASAGYLSATSTVQNPVISLFNWDLSQLTITPLANWTGSFTASVVATNTDYAMLSGGLTTHVSTASQDVAITIGTPVNQAPEAQDDHLIFSASSIYHEAETGFDILSFSFDYLAVNDDPDGGDTFTSAYAEPNHGFVASNSGAEILANPYHSGVLYKLPSQQSMPFTDTFQYSIANGNDGHATSTATVTLSVVAGNELIGGATNDIIVGGAADEVMTGNGGADGFVFSANFGHDTVTDFHAGTDKLVFSDTSFHDAQDVLAALSGTTDAVITDGANTVTLTGVAPGTLTADDILIHHSYLV